MFCTNCGKELHNNTKTCSNCGAIPSIPVKSSINEETTPTSFEKNGQAGSYNNSTKALTKYNKPLSTLAFFFTQILFMLPIINLFFILLWSFKKNTNENRKAYARSILIWVIITFLFIIFILLTMAFMHYPISLNVWFRDFKNYLNSVPNI